MNYSSSESEEEGMMSIHHMKNIYSFELFLFLYIDVKPLHVVNTTAEMPEGAKFSDSDDKETAYDPDDPHRALDIDLEGYFVYIFHIQAYA